MTFPPANRPLSDRLPAVNCRELAMVEIKRFFPHHTDTVYFAETTCDPVFANAYRAEQWSQPEFLDNLLKQFALYHQSGNVSKPLCSLWSQWYFGLLFPPVITVLLRAKRWLNTDYRYFSLQPDSKEGRAKRFVVETHWYSPFARTDDTPLLRLCDFIQRHLNPFIALLDAQGFITAKFLWSNAG